MITSVYGWFVHNGLWPSVVTFLVGAAGGWLFGRLGLRKAWRTHLGHLRRIVDLLDTETPGGLAEVVDAIRNAGTQGDEPMNESDGRR